MNLSTELLDLITVMDEDFNKLNGAEKVALLKSVASYYENLTAAEATVQIYKQTFEKL